MINLAKTSKSFDRAYAINPPAILKQHLQYSYLTFLFLVKTIKTIKTTIERLKDLEALKKQTYLEAVVLITGDHGQDFRERVVERHWEFEENLINSSKLDSETDWRGYWRDSMTTSGNTNQKKIIKRSFPESEEAGNKNLFSHIPLIIHNLGGNLN